MSLSTAIVERIFKRLVAVYANEFLSKLPERVEDLNSVKGAWAYELAPWAENLDAIAWALDHLPERPPNVIVFKNIVRQAPDTRPNPALAAPATKPDPGHILAEVDAIRVKVTTAPRHDPKAWAKAILSRHEAGEKLSPAAVTMARNAVSHLHA